MSKFDATVIRSIVRCRSDDPAPLVLGNVQAVRDARVEFLLPEDGEIWAFVDQFVRDHEHPPEIQTTVSHLRSIGQVGAADRMEVVCAERLKTKGDFLHILEQVCEERRVRLLEIAWRDARLIATAGLEVGEGRNKRTLRGAQDAASYVVDAMREVAVPTFSSHLSGEIISDTDEGYREYQQREDDPSAAFGEWTGLKQMDESLGGARVAELWIHAAYSGHLKTTFALNWAYNRAIWFHDHVLYFSLEMPYHQVRRWIYAMHSFHPKFTQVRVELGLQQEGGVDVGLDYKRIRDGGLSPVEKTFYRDHVLADLKNPENGYGRIVIEVADPDKPDVTVDGLRARAESIYPKTPFRMVVVDHATLVGARGRYTSTIDRLNDALRDLKRLALRFRRGQGIPVVALYQINREGLKEARKRKEKGQLPTYEIDNLANSAEAERSADVVTASYLDKEYADRGRALFTCLKSRDNEPFNPFLAQIHWPCRRLGTCIESPKIDYSTQADPADITATLARMKA